MAKKAILTFLCSLTLTLLFAQEKRGADSIQKRKYQTTRIKEGAIRIDGIPDEETWDQASWSGDFIQYQPNEKAAPSQQSFFKILYDKKFLYIAYRAVDTAPDSIIKRMARRDEFPGDWMEINIDSYHDQRTAFSFTLSVSGVRGDEFISANGDSWDQSWNPIWFARTHIDSAGWTGEIKIPFSQLRYGNEKEKVWGIQVQRRIFRKEERSTWQYIPQNAGVWVSAFGELHGLNELPAQKQVELAPYVVGQTSRYQKQEGNPFATGSDSRLSLGMDGKVAITSDLILDFTINPDFGQVEADPSQVRIDGFQNFFEERRPFFIESRNIFDYRLTGSAAGGDYDSDLLFYSRRIGSSPHGYPNLGSGEYANVPDKTAILGAAKFSGKTKNGWSIGILESITRREYATIDNAGQRRNLMVEPLTSYFVGRLQKDIDAGNTVVGGIVTAVNREQDLEHNLHQRAYSGGLDFLHYWKNRTWYYSGRLVVSHVEGAPASIYNTQTSIEHLFQRSNIREAAIDPTRTSLTGTGGTFKLGKNGGRSGKLNQVLKFETGFTWRSPELELNDIGFMLSANEINHFTWAGLFFQKPFSHFRNARISYNHWARWDFGGQFLYQAFNVNTHATFKNFWSFGVGLDLNPWEVSNTALRGGSSIRRPAGWGNFAYLNSDSRKKLTGGINVGNGYGFNNTVAYNDYSIFAGLQPIDAFSVNLNLGFTEFFRKQDQFVDETVFEGNRRTIVGEVKQQTVRLTLRLNYNITPDLTIQYYGQPYITRPLYNHFGYVTDPLNARYEDRFHRYTPEELTQNGDMFEVDENGDGIRDYSFYKPDFNFVQFRSNLVIRWEYRPGSEFYLVWSQGSTPDVAGDLYSPISQSLFSNLFNQPSRNIGLVKFTYRFLK
ncbi:MAG: hydrolase [Sphingobacteriales bacterium]|nr:MAG: hydrolase [Sphingobacteriales bacterium]